MSWYIVWMCGNLYGTRTRDGKSSHIRFDANWWSNQGLKILWVYVNFYGSEDLRCRIEPYPARYEVVMEPMTWGFVLYVCKPVSPENLRCRIEPHPVRYKLVMKPRSWHIVRMGVNMYWTDNLGCRIELYPVWYGPLMEPMTWYIVWMCGNLYGTRTRDVKSSHIRFDANWWSNQGIQIFRVYVNLYGCEDWTCRIEPYPARYEVVMEPMTWGFVSYVCKPVSPVDFRCHIEPYPVWYELVIVRMGVNLYWSEDLGSRIERYPVRYELVMEPRTLDVVLV